MTFSVLIIISKIVAAVENLCSKAMFLAGC